MDKDRIKGSANQAKGSIKEAAGKVTGDSKLKAEGAMDKARGKVQSAVGARKTLCAANNNQLCNHVETRRLTPAGFLSLSVRECSPGRVVPLSSPLLQAGIE